MHPRILVMFTFGLGAVADEHTYNTLKELRKATGDFHQRMNDWDGSYFGAVPVLKHSRDLRNTLHAAMSPDSNDKAILAPRDDDMEMEAMSLAKDLVDDIGSMIDSAIQMKPKMEGIPFAGKRVGMMVFKSLHSAANSLGKEFSPRASEEHRESAEEIVKAIDEHFLRGLAAYEEAVAE